MNDNSLSLMANGVVNALCSMITIGSWSDRIILPKNGCTVSPIFGPSRHLTPLGHDIDIFDPTRLPSGGSLQLTPSEYRIGGIFEDLTHWLDEMIAANNCEGFFRPYDRDRGGVSEEPWHLSYEPVASMVRLQLTTDTLRDLWLREPGLRPDGYNTILPLLDDLMDRYVV